MGGWAGPGHRTKLTEAQGTIRNIEKPKSAYSVRVSTESNPGNHQRSNDRSFQSPVNAAERFLLQRMFTARAPRTTTVPSEMQDRTIILAFVQRDSTGTSVGENAVLVSNAKKR